jgi:hypothetical protein
LETDRKRKFGTRFRKCFYGFIVKEIRMYKYYRSFGTRHARREVWHIRVRVLYTVLYDICSAIFLSQQEHPSRSTRNSRSGIGLRNTSKTSLHFKITTGSRYLGGFVGSRRSCE